MEKKEAVREWCFDRALAIANLPLNTRKNPEIKTEDIVKIAQEIEKYINAT